MSYWLVPYALLAYVGGVLFHELTHVIAAWVLGVPVTGFSLAWNRVTVHYDPASHHQDGLIRAAPIVVFLPLAFACAVWFNQNQSLDRGLFVFAVLMGYLPRSQSDWNPVVRMLASDSF